MTFAKVGNYVTAIFLSYIQYSLNAFLVYLFFLFRPNSCSNVRCLVYNLNDVKVTKYLLKL